MCVAVQEEQQRKIQELNKQRELFYTAELERERRRQHTALIKNLEARKRYEDRGAALRFIFLDFFLAFRIHRLNSKRVFSGLFFCSRLFCFPCQSHLLASSYITQ